MIVAYYQPRRRCNPSLYHAPTVYIGGTSPLVNNMWSFPPQPSGTGFICGRLPPTLLIVDVAIPFLRPLLQSNRSMQQYHTGELADNILMVMGSECCVYHGDVGGAMPKFRWRREMKKLRDLL